MDQKKSFVDHANEENLERLKQRALVVHKEKLQRIKAFAAANPDHPFSIANRQLVAMKEEDDFWNAAGVLSMTGVGWWALNLSADLAYPNVVIFNATGGPDWTVAVFTSAVAGYFYVDPSKLSGECNFHLQSVAGVLGEVSLDLFKSDGTQIATFLGAVVGVSLSTLSGTGTIYYNP